MENVIFSEKEQLFCRMVAAAVVEALKNNNVLPDSEPVMSREEVSHYLNVSYTTLWVWAKTKKLLPFKVGRRVMYHAKDVVSLLSGEQ